MSRKVEGLSFLTFGKYSVQKTTWMKSTRGFLFSRKMGKEGFDMAIKVSC